MFQKILLALLFVLCLPLSAYSQEKTVNEDLPKQQASCEYVSDNNEWIDITHQYINESLCVPAVWFDSFFATDRHDEEIKPGSYVRWSNDFIETEGVGFDYVTKVRASIRLPKASKKLKLVFEGEQEDSLEDIVSVNEEEAKTDVGLLYELFQSSRSNINIKLNLSPKISLRYRYAYPFTETLLTRFTQEFFQSDLEAGAISRLDVEKRLNTNLLLRWTNSSKQTDIIDGYEWSSALVLYQKLSDLSALSYEASVSGLTEPETYHSNERIALRYRRNFYRKWLFYELVPEITRPKELITDQRSEVSAFMFRLEIKFNSL